MTEEEPAGCPMLEELRTSFDVKAVFKITQ